MNATVAEMKAQATAPGTTKPLSAEELQKINAYWRACNYLAAGMIYLRDNLSKAQVHVAM